MSKLESVYQAKLIERIKRRFPSCVVLKNDEQYQQGIPDLLVLHHEKWAMLEVKRDKIEMEHPGPNQEHWVNRLDRMSFAAFICPSNEQEVLDALQQSFESGR